MDQTLQVQLPEIEQPGYRDAWSMVTGQLQREMSKALFETWVEPLKPLGYNDRTFTVSAYNSYGREWVESRLKGRITRILQGLYNDVVSLDIVVGNGYHAAQSSTYHENARTGQTAECEEDQPEARAGAGEEPQEKPRQNTPPPSTRKVMLQRAYGSERARLIQPERGMFVTLYLFERWLPLIGHSAFTVILAARSMCYWNPLTGEKRNIIETDMAEIARRASVSVRTVKDVLNNEWVKKYFLRYLVRRIMTPNGVRTAGITLQVRMDDPLTPEDQDANHISEDEEWYTIEIED